MRILASVVYCLCAAAALAQTRFEAFADGKKIGTVSFTQRLGADGSKSVDVRMELEAANQKLTLRTQNTYDRLGNPIRKFLDANIPGGKLQRQIVATFDKNGANIVKMDGGTRTTRQIPLVESAPRNNASEFWLVRDKPREGDSVRCYVFNIDTLSWDLQTIHFRGQRTIKVGTRSVVAYLIESIGASSSKAYLDEKGVPWLIETASTTIRRIGK